jgi:uncharacterized membrane protein
MRFVHLFFFVVYGLVSWVNHYYLRSAALDYGIANQAMYLYSHGLTPTVTMLLGEHPACHYLGLHFSLWVPILSPFYWIFGSYTLLIFQNLFLVFGALGLAKLAATFQYTKLEQGLIQMHYYVFFGIYNALAVDYHDNVIAASLLPWLVYGYYHSKTAISILAFIGMLIAKENIAIWMLAIAVGLWFLVKQKNAFQQWMPVCMLLVAVLWFLACSFWLMPLYSSTGKFEQLSRYSHLGKSLGEIVAYIVTHPIEMIRMFFLSHVQPDADEIYKQEFLWALLFSGAWLWLRKPAFLVMALPLLMQKMWNKETAFWGMNNHYQVEFAALLSLALIFVFKEFASKNRYWFIGLVAMMALVQTVTSMQHRKVWFDPMRENVFELNRYRKPKLIAEKLAFFKSIDSEAKVCAQSNFLPHLANRKEAYHFPYTQEAQWVILDEAQASYYPLNEKEGKSYVDSLQQSAYWETVPNKHGLILLRRKS